MKLPVSVCILTKNEEVNLPDCLESVREIAGEIVILDSGSTDRTPEIAQTFGARFEFHPFDDFGSQYNRLFGLAREEWILNLDADERLSEPLRESIRDLFTHPGNIAHFDGFSFNRLNFFIGKPIRHSGWSPDHLVRLFRKSAGEMERRQVHVQVLVNGNIGHLEGDLIHFTYRTMDSYLAKSVQYARLAAIEMKKKGQHPSIFSLLTHPPAMAIKMYIIKRGFMDGKEGLFLAILYSYYTFLKYLYLFYNVYNEGP